MRFADGGQGFTAPIDNPVLLATENGLLLEDFFFYESAILDVRAYQSYALRVSLTDGSMTDRDIIGVDVNFYQQSSGANRSFFDSFRLYKTNILGSSEFFLTDVCHGSWMQLGFFDYFSVDRTVELTYDLYGSYRPVSNTFIRSNTGLQTYQHTDILGAGANNGGTLGFFAYGPAQMGLKSGAGGGATMDIIYAEDNTLFDQLKVTAANTVATKQIVLPRAQMKVTITNDGGAGSTIRSYVIQQLQPF